MATEVPRKKNGLSARSLRAKTRGKVRKEKRINNLGVLINLGIRAMYRVVYRENPNMCIMDLDFEYVSTFRLHIYIGTWSL